jgi:hypothetical protein
MSALSISTIFRLVCTFIWTFWFSISMIFLSISDVNGQDKNNSSKNQLPPAAVPQEINSLSKEVYPQSYYDNQGELWKSIAENNPSNAEAWYNYWLSIRNYDMVRSRTVSQGSQSELRNIVSNLEMAAPNSWEYHFLKYISQGHDPGAAPHLLQAYKADPARSETYPELMALYDFHDNQKSRKEIAEKWLNSKEIPPEVLGYNYNVLMSLSPSAILITQGEYDTYPIWILQDIRKIRPDVMVINDQLAENVSYRKGIMNRIGLKDPRDGKTMGDKSSYYRTLMEINPNRKFYLAMTLLPKTIKPLSTELYTTGLVFSISKQETDNIVQLKTNFNQKFDIEYIKKAQAKNIKLGPGPVSTMHLNYILPLMMLHDQYLNEGNTKEAEKLKSLSLYIGRQAGKEHELRQYINTKR